MNREQLDRLEEEFEAANVAIGEATWNTYSGEATADLEGAYQRLTGLLTREEEGRMIEEWFDAVDPARDPLLSRRLRIWLHCFRGAAVENAPDIAALRTRLQTRIAAFTFSFGGKEIRRSELQKILRNETDRGLRRSAWLATAPLAEANREDLKRLIALRNRRARELGFRDYVAFVLRLQDLDESWLFGMLDRLSAAALPVYRGLIRSLSERIEVRQLAPWDVPYAMRQGFQLPNSHFPPSEALNILFRTAWEIGFPAEKLPIRTLVKDIPFGGYNVAVRIPSDTRFLVNPSEGHAFYTTTFHEFGHSLQAVCTATPWPILKEYEWPLGAHTAAYSEGMAEVFGEFARRPDWLARVAQVPDAKIRDYIERILPCQAAMRLFELLLNMKIELAAYAADGEGVAERERDLNREVRLLDFPEDIPPVWAANTWYTSYPVYWQNYILASVIAAQVHDALNNHFGTAAAASSGVAEYLRSRFYERGGEAPWHDRIRRGTGRELQESSYLARLSASKA